MLVKHSKCRSDFLNRVKLSEQLKRAAKESGKPVPLSSIKRQVSIFPPLSRSHVFDCFSFQPQGPRKQHLVRTGGNKPQIVEPIPYQFVA